MGEGVHGAMVAKTLPSFTMAACAQPSSTVSSLPRVLLTGFDPFGDTGQSSLPLNPSWMAVKALGGKRIAGHLVVAAQLPTVFQDSIA
jgi:pyroglutamyl-peptidase